MNNPGSIEIAKIPPNEHTVHFPPDTSLEMLIDFTNDCGICMLSESLIKKWEKYMPYLKKE